MYEQIIYKNHINEVIKFGEAGIFVNENELHDYDWNYSDNNNKVSNFTRGIKTKNVPVVIACAEESDGVKAINALMECTEKDILAEKTGKIIIGDYYFNCYITSSKKSKYSGKKGFVKAALTVVSDNPVWIKETKKSFNRNGSGQVSGKNLDFPYGQPFDFTPNTGTKEINNTGFTSVNFKMVIYGPCTSPSIYISDHKYALDGCSAQTGEYIVIDSMAKTIQLVKNNGAVINYFMYRNRDSYIFEKIPSGVNIVNWTDDFNFDITLYEERSEPKWT